MAHLPTHNMRWMQPMWSHLQTLLGYHHQGQPASPPENHHNPQVDAMTGEAGADPMLGCTRETEVQDAQDTPAQTGTPAGTETQDGDTCQTTTEPRANHPTGSGQAITDH